MAALPHQQRFEVQHVFFPQDDEGSRAAESVAAVGLQARHPTQTALPVLTATHTHTQTHREAAAGKPSVGNVRNGSLQLSKSVWR